jgi:phage terminase large subunit
MKPEIIPQTNVEDQIKSARMLFPRVYMAEDKTARLQNCLKRYRRAIPESTGEPGSPVHDEYSHGASAFGGLALIVDRLKNDSRPKPNVAPYEPLDKDMGY